MKQIITYTWIAMLLFCSTGASAETPHAGLSYETIVENTAIDLYNMFSVVVHADKIGKNEIDFEYKTSDKKALKRLNKQYANAFEDFIIEVTLLSRQMNNINGLTLEKIANDVKCGFEDDYNQSYKKDEHLPVQYSKEYVEYFKKTKDKILESLKIDPEDEFIDMETVVQVVEMIEIE